MSDTQNLAFEKTETEVYKAKIQFARLLEYAWQSGREYALNDYARPTRATGFAYQASVGGQSSSKEPRWPKTLAGTVVDGSITWTAVAVDANSTDSIGSVNIPTVTGLTVSVPTISGTRVLFDISGGTKGRTYEISLEITTSASEVFEEKISVYIKSE